MSLKGKTIIISGATRGIGKAIAFELANSGANISFSFLKSEGEAKKAEKELNSIGIKAKGFKVDISDFDSVSDWVVKTKELFNNIDIVVNNAGIIKDKALALMSKEEWCEVINTNLGGTFNLTHACIIGLIKQKSGNIINITSASGIIGLSRQSNYSASKAGIIGFTKSLAKELAPYNIRVNAVAPGFISTDMLSELNGTYKEKIISRIPLNRVGKVEDVSKIVKFLADDTSSYITGQTLIVDGRMSLAI